MNTILVVDDEKAVRYSFKRMFEDEYSIIFAEDGGTAIRTFEACEDKIDVIFLDVRMPDINGIEVLKRIREKTKNIPVIVMTAFGDSDTAIRAMKEGAFDYLTKPFESDQLKDIIEKALASERLQHGACCNVSECPIHLGKAISGAEVIVGKSQAIINVCKMVGQVANTDFPVLITGESGVGKELIALAIYTYSNRKGNPFLAVNCAALPEGIVESELFGCEKGAFTGAEKRRIGRFEQCDKGTIFLDEVGDMSLYTQAKLLRVLHDGSFERVGSNETLGTDVRIIAASNKNLPEEVKNGRFREDLFHRLNVFPIHIPPLRERIEDIPVLAEYFLSRTVKETGRQVKGFSPEVIKNLISYHWPGNVRELENIVRRATVVAKGAAIDAGDLILNTELYKKELHELSEVVGNIFERAVAAGNTADILHSVVSSVEKTLIENALRMTNGNQVQASTLLGITRVTLRKKMQEYNIPSG
ncbi:MAG: sigma-54 dependent transcriptional regulator [Thermodesulfovibrionia bacterium]|nr:sigma-54 dependent transcriptional regulator [Thermodesulfovibrionia bacterium]